MCFCRRTCSFWLNGVREGGGEGVGGEGVGVGGEVGGEKKEVEKERQLLYPAKNGKSSTLLLSDLPLNLNTEPN